LHPTTQCDSEVLGLLIGAVEGNFRERCGQAASAAGRSPFAMLGVWSRPARLIAIRAGNPLAVGECPGGRRFYLGSYTRGLPTESRLIPDGTGIEFTPKGVVEFDLPPRTEATAPGKLFN